MKNRKPLSRTQARLAAAHKNHEILARADKLWVWAYRTFARCRNVSEVIIPVRGHRPMRIKIEHPEDTGGQTAA